MVIDKQVRSLFKLLAIGKTLRAAAARADMDEKAARKYRKLGKLPSELEVSHTWRRQAGRSSIRYPPTSWLLVLRKR